MKLPFNLSSMDVSKAPDPTPEQILEYRNETDHDKRMDLAYGCLIKSEDLYPEDLDEIMKDYQESLEDHDLEYVGMRDMGDL